jgi:hypothetical protein
MRASKKKKNGEEKKYRLLLAYPREKIEEYNQLAEKYWESMSIRVHIHALFSLIN